MLFIGGVAQGMTHLFINIAFFTIRYYHHSSYLVVTAYRMNKVNDIVVLAHHIAHSERVNKEFSQPLVVESLCVQLAFEIRRTKVFQLPAVLIVHQHHLRFVRLAVGTQPAVEGNVHHPAAKVGPGNTSSQHAFELNAELKGHIVDIISVCNNNIFA